MIWKSFNTKGTRYTKDFMISLVPLVPLVPFCINHSEP
jgi:hypothetical protein